MIMLKITSLCLWEQHTYTTGIREQMMEALNNSAKSANFYQTTHVTHPRPQSSSDCVFDRLSKQWIT